MKTSLPRLNLSLLMLFSSWALADDISCLRELIPLTDKVSFSGERANVEKPFLLNAKYIVFPEVKDGKVSGFFVYGNKRGQYYDAVQAAGKKVLAKTALTELTQDTVYNMVAQPDGLETVTIAFAPFLKSVHSRTPSSAALGASMLPVIGAFVALQEKRSVQAIYTLPEESLIEGKPRKLMQLTNKTKKSAWEIQQPIKEELEIRKRWIQKANLDDATFIDLNRILQHSCNSL